MKRSGSKLISKAGSMRNINKQGYKFTVKVHCESVDKVLSASDVVLSWERNDKVRTTKSVRVDRDSRAADFRGEILTQDITFFKRKKDGASFEDKPFRLVLRHDDGSKKAIGKIDLNFSQYIDIPTSSKRLAADLSNGSKLIIRVESKFLREVTKKSRKQDDTSSVGSAFENESEFDPTDYNEMTANLDDLDVGDDPPLSNPTSSVSQPNSFSSVNSNNHHDPPSAAHSQSNSHPSQQTQLSTAPVLSSLSSASTPTSMTSATPNRRPPLAPSNSITDDPLGPATSAPATLQSSAPAHRRASGPSASPGGRDIIGRGRRSRDTSPNRDGLQTGAKALVSGGNGRFRRSGSRQDSLDTNTAPAVSKQEFDALQKENRQLRRRNDDLQTRVAELEHRLENYASMASGNAAPGLMSSDSMARAELDDLMQENKSLKEHVEDLEMRIRREPIYADVVRDLREAKMALAIMNIERDELKQEIRKLKK